MFEVRSKVEKPVELQTTISTYANICVILAEN